MFGLFSKQLQEALSPAAAHLGGKKDHERNLPPSLPKLPLHYLVTTPLYAFCAAYLGPVIKILSGLKQVDHSTFWVGQALLLATYSSMLTNSCPKRVLVMCGWESQLLKVSATDAALNFHTESHSGVSARRARRRGGNAYSHGTRWLALDAPVDREIYGRSSAACLRDYSTDSRTDRCLARSSGRSSLFLRVPRPAFWDACGAARSFSAPPCFLAPPTFATSSINARLHYKQSACCFTGAGHHLTADAPVACLSLCSLSVESRHLSPRLPPRPRACPASRRRSLLPCRSGDPESISRSSPAFAGG